mmetsp:Transcript_16003/g.41152  ORF Transcript_16003/g.41152 Transcript_16003/m.41152 type:complete len:460 (+) Transcript_16003:238-1617(+)
MTSPAPSATPPSSRPRLSLRLVAPLTVIVALLVVAATVSVAGASRSAAAADFDAPQPPDRDAAEPSSTPTETGPVGALERLKEKKAPFLALPAEHRAVKARAIRCKGPVEGRAPRVLVVLDGTYDFNVNHAFHLNVLQVSAWLLYVADGQPAPEYRVAVSFETWDESAKMSNHRRDFAASAGLRLQALDWIPRPGAALPSPCEEEKLASDLRPYVWSMCVRLAALAAVASTPSQADCVDAAVSNVDFPGFLRAPAYFKSSNHPPRAYLQTAHDAIRATTRAASIDTPWQPHCAPFPAGPVLIGLYARRDVKKRRWANVNENLAALRKSGIGRVCEFLIPGTFLAQVALFRAFDVVVLPHGAAGANALFMRRATALVEVSNRCLPVDNARNGEWAGWMQEYVGFVRRVVPCEILFVNGSKGVGNSHVGLPEHFQVHPRELVKAVRAAMEEGSSVTNRSVD